MKKIIFLFLILILSVVSAAEINAPQEIPANINWSFSIDLDSSNEFTKTEVYFDDLLIVNAYNDKQPVIQQDFVLKAFVFDKIPEDNAGLTLFVSYFGIQEGTHKLRIKTFNGNAFIDEKEIEVNSIDTITAIQNLPKEVSQDVDLIIKNLIDKLNEQKQKLDEIENSNEQNIIEKTSVLKEEITALENSLNELQEIKKQEEAEKLLEEEKLKQIELNEIKPENLQEENFVTGFYSFSVDNAWKGMVFLIVLLVLFALFNLYKIKKSDDTVFEEVLKEKAINENKRKFSFAEREAEDEDEKNGKRFGLSDLLKK